VEVLLSTLQLLRALARHRSLPVAAVVLATATTLPSAASASNPAIGVRPGEESAVHAEAAKDAGGEVHMALSWRKIEPNDVASPDFTDVEAKFNTFLPPEGPGIASVRVIDAPEWAAGGCRYTESGSITSCPPTKDFYPDFKEFVTQAVEEMGPDTEFDIERFILWNEPGAAKKWGGKTVEQGSYREYSNLLNQFHPAIRAAENGGSVSVEAGEVAAGGNKPITWARKFTQYNTDHDRNGNYGVLTIHAYAGGANGVVENIKEHDRLSGVTNVAVSEFGWAVGTPAPNVPGDADYKCTSLSGQRSKFRDTVQMVRNQTTGVKALVWLNVIDEMKGKTKCLDSTSYYCCGTRDDVSPYGLYKRDQDGSTDTFAELEPRPIVNTFQKAAAGEPLGARQSLAGYEGDSPILAPLSALPLSGLL
jgi:hypothetical protein